MPFEIIRNDITVYLVVCDKAAFLLSEKLFLSIAQYIDDKYIEEHPFNRRDRFEGMHQIRESYIQALDFFSTETPVTAKEHKRSLDDVVKNMDETFIQVVDIFVELQYYDSTIE